jgi:diazepam-binding inhibitor (GABA receptor modulating acyl-CoA-binding protein)
MDFQTAITKVKTLKTKPDNSTLLKLYGLYKQATLGDCNTAQPWAINFEDRAKWDAWNHYKGKTKERAKEKYVKLATELLTKDKLI